MKLGDFSTLDDAEGYEALRATIAAFNLTSSAYPRDSTVHAQFAARAVQTPEAVAVLDAGKRHTYGEVAARANRIAHFLEGKGLAKEGFVGVMVDGAFDLVTALLGTLQAGGAYLPLDPDLPGARLGFMLRETRARVLIGGRRHIRRLNRLQWECPELAVLLCPDSGDIHGETEGVGEFMSEEVWDYVGRETFDDISGGGWRSSYTGEWLSRAVMDEYGDNIRAKLAPRLTAQSRVLEIGCASGISMFRLAPLVAYYHGTDLSAEILRWSQREVERRGLANIRLQHLPAHELRRVAERSFDCVVVNSVLQCFSGHNYLRRVLRDSIDLMADTGTVFLGNVWDQELQGQFERELAEFQRQNAASGVRTKVDRSEDLFVARAPNPGSRPRQEGYNWKWSLFAGLLIFGLVRIFAGLRPITTASGGPAAKMIQTADGILGKNSRNRSAKTAWVFGTAVRRLLDDEAAKKRLEKKDEYGPAGKSPRKTPMNDHPLP